MPTETNVIEYQIVVPEALNLQLGCWETRLHCHLLRIDALISRILFGPKWRQKKNRPELGVGYGNAAPALTFEVTLHPPITWKQFKPAFREAITEVLPIDAKTIQYKKVNR